MKNGALCVRAWVCLLTIESVHVSDRCVCKCMLQTTMVLALALCLLVWFSHFVWCPQMCAHWVEKAPKVAKTIFVLPVRATHKTKEKDNNNNKFMYEIKCDARARQRAKDLKPINAAYIVRLPYKFQYSNFISWHLGASKRIHSLTHILALYRCVCKTFSLFSFFFSIFVSLSVYMSKRSCVCWGIQSSTVHTRTHTHAKVNTYHLMLLNALLRFFRSFFFIFFVVPFILLIHLFFVWLKCVSLYAFHTKHSSCICRCL